MIWSIPSLVLPLIVLVPPSTCFSINRQRERGQPHRLFSSTVSLQNEISSSSAVVRNPATDATASPPPPPSPEESVIYPGITVDTRIWKSICPTVLDNAQGADVRRHWTNDPPTTVPVANANNDDDNKQQRVAQKVAVSIITEISQQQKKLSAHDKRYMQSLLAQALLSFMTFCREHLDNVDGFTARIVASRGTLSTKCPAWHQDHVPVRWIQSLVGPGVEWVLLDEANNDGKSQAFSWTSNNNDDDDDDESSLLSVQELNQRRVPADSTIYQASPGQAVMLVGRLWNQYCRKDSDSEYWLPAVVHKSPSGLPPWQGRVLLTMDVVVAPPLPAEEDR